MKTLARTATLVLGLSLLLSGCGAGTTEPQDPPDTQPDTSTPKTANLIEHIATLSQRVDLAGGDNVVADNSFITITTR